MLSKAPEIIKNLFAASVKNKLNSGTETLGQKFQKLDI